MNKMERPMMTIVRFGAEDVIATSSPLLVSHSPYVALGSEINQAQGAMNEPSTELNGNALYQVNYDGSNYTYGAEVGNDTAMPYAWFTNGSNGQWVSDNEAPIFYGGNLPKVFNK